MIQNGSTKNYCRLHSNFQVLDYSMKDMNSSKRTQMGGDLSAVSDVQLARTAEFSVFLLYNERLEIATIVKGGNKQ